MFRTIQSKLFFTYSTFILIIVISFTAFYFMHTSKSIEEKASEALYTMAYSINTQLDSELENMNSTITKIWYSETFKKLFFMDINSEAGAYLENQRMLKESVLTAMGPDFPVSRVSIFQENGNFFSVGLLQEQVKFSQQQIMQWDWVQRALEAGKRALIVPPHQDDWMLTDNSVISLCKTIDTYAEGPPVIIEIQQNYSKFEKLIYKSLMPAIDGESSEKNVLIYDQNGTIVFPYEKRQDASINQKISLYKQSLEQVQSPSQTIRVQDPLSQEKEVVAFHQSNLSGWTVAVAEKEKVLLSSVVSLRTTTILASVVILVATMIVSYFVSKTLTTPINKILKNMRRLSLEALPEKAFSVDSGIDELEELNQSFGDMCVKLKDSLDEIVVTRSHEIQSRMLALQAQMNPHFLYNTIANIAVMAEDNQDTEVVYACKNLSSMLRFISSKSEAPISIMEELSHTECFINLMKIRHEDALSLLLDIPEKMNEIMIPKLVIEPLVENCTKYAIHVDPPWNIRVEGECSENHWIVCVKDNGPGFEEAVLKSIKNKIQEIDLKKPTLDLKFGGMGLINIYVRLKLLYGQDTIFEVSNLSHGGALVKIGGTILQMRKEANDA